MQTLNDCYKLSCLSIAVWVMLLNGSKEKKNCLGFVIKKATVLFDPHADCPKIFS